MNLTERAETIKGPVAAMRQSEDWALELHGDTNMGETRQREIESGLDILERRYPELGKFSGSAEEFAESRGHGRGSRGGKPHSGRRRPGTPGKGRPSTPPAKRKPTARPEPKRPARARAAGRGRMGPRATRLIRQTGVPGAIESGTSATMMFLGATLGLSIVYLLLSSAERPGSGGYALPQMLKSITGFLQRFISTGDILGGNRAPAAVPTYSERAVAGEVAGPPNPNLPQLPRKFQPRGQVTGHLPQRLPKWELEALRHANPNQRRGTR